MPAMRAEDDGNHDDDETAAAPPSAHSDLPDPPVPSRGPVNKPALLLVCLLLAAHATLGWLAVRDKSATADEGLHLAASIAQSRLFDFRVDREDPPLWKFWAGLPSLVWPPASLRTDTMDWHQMPGSAGLQFRWATDVLYRTPGNDADALLARSRAMMIVISVALGALIAWWAWRLGGAIAAVVAVALFALDPNFL